MSKQPLIPPVPISQNISWFGKLPGLGDFVGRRMPHAFRTEWDLWLRAGMEQLRNDAPTNWGERFVQSPLWFFVAGAGVAGVAMCGAVAPSIDRVGRFYPISVVAMARADESSLIGNHGLSHFFGGVREAIVDARRLAWPADDLDVRLATLPWPFSQNKGNGREPSSVVSDILSELERSGVDGNTTAAVPVGTWRELNDPRAAQSMWWVSPSHHEKREEFSHHGPLEGPLFTRLFQGQGR